MSASLPRNTEVPDSNLVMGMNILFVMVRKLALRLKEIRYAYRVQLQNSGYAMKGDRVAVIPVDQGPKWVVANQMSLSERTAHNTFS